MSSSPAHDWFRPRLLALVEEAKSAGYAQDVSVAVITDLMNGPMFSPAPAAADEDWNRDIGEPDGAVNQGVGGGVVGDAVGPLGSADAILGRHPGDTTGLGRI